MSRIGDGRSRLRTRIISSGVTPLATQAGDEGAGAGPDVHVELVDGRVGGQQVERSQRADLVYAAGEPAAAEHQRGLRRTLASASAARPLGSAADSISTTLPMGKGIIPPATRVSPHPRLNSLRMTRPRHLICLLASGAPSRRPPPPPAAHARRQAGTARATLSALRARVRGSPRDLRSRRRRQRGLGLRLDANGDGQLYGNDADERRIPASNEKLFTTAAFLSELGPTRICRPAPTPAASSSGRPQARRSTATSCWSATATRLSAPHASPAPPTSRPRGSRSWRASPPRRGPQDHGPGARRRLDLRPQARAPGPT